MKQLRGKRLPMIKQPEKGDVRLIGLTIDRDSFGVVYARISCQTPTGERVAYMSTLSDTTPDGTFRFDDHATWHDDLNDVFNRALAFTMHGLQV